MKGESSPGALADCPILGDVEREDKEGLVGVGESSVEQNTVVSY